MVDLHSIKLSKRRRRLLTTQFMVDFADNLETVLKYDIRSCGLLNNCGTSGFYTALRLTCEKHNVVKAIYNFLHRQPWYVSDVLEEEIMFTMVERGVLLEDEVFGVDNSTLMNDDNTGLYKMTTITKYNGYSVVETEWTDDELEARYPPSLKPNQTIVYEKDGGANV